MLVTADDRDAECSLLLLLMLRGTENTKHPVPRTSTSMHWRGAMQLCAQLLTPTYSDQASSWTDDSNRGGDERSRLIALHAEAGDSSSGSSSSI